MRHLAAKVDFLSQHWQAVMLKPVGEGLLAATQAYMGSHVVAYSPSLIGHTQHAVLALQVCANNMWAT